MFRQILLTQWKWARVMVLFAVVAAFALPVMSVQSLPTAADTWIDGRRVLGAMRSWSGLYPLLAMVLGVALALSAWAADHRGRHVYALSLPVERWRFALMRCGAGALLVLPVALALWIGALFAAASVEIPPGLEAFPTSVAFRFALATLVGYAIFFSIASGTVRTAGWVLGAISLLIFGPLILSAVGVPISFSDEIEMVLFTWPGVFEIFTGRWMLIDV